MAEPSGYSETRDDAGVGSDRETTTGIPRWVWVSVLIVAVVALAIVAMMLIGGGHTIPDH